MNLRDRFAVCLALCGLLLWFLADAAYVRSAVVQALSLCGRSVIPALFPFLVVSSLLLSLGFGDLAARRLAGMMEPLFRVPGVGSAALLLGLIGGYPIGAKTAADLYQAQLLSKPEAQRLLTFSNNSNPVFLISVLGLGVFGSVRIGVWLWLIHVLSALLTGLLCRGMGGASGPQPLTRNPPFHSVRFSSAFVAAVRGALSGILSVCAFVTLFYVLAQPLAGLPFPVGPALVGALELFSLAPLLPATPGGFLLAAGAAGWGGLSVLCQTAAVLDGSDLPVMPCLRGKLLQAALSVGLAWALVPWVF